MTTLFVRNLPYAVDESQLRELFEGIGPGPINVKLVFKNGLSSGYGFVTFASEEWANAAIDTLNQAIIGGRRIEVKLAQRPHKTQQPQQQQKQKLHRNQPQHQFTSSQPLFFNDNADDDDDNDHDPFMGRFSQQQRAAPPAAPDWRWRSEGAQSTPSSSRTTALVANLAPSVTSAQLKRLFAGFEIADAVVAVRDGSVSLGYGFVLFRNHNAMQQAIALMNGLQCEGRPITVRASTTEFAIEKMRYENNNKAASSTSSYSSGNASFQQPDVGGGHAMSFGGADDYGYDQQHDDQSAYHQQHEEEDFSTAHTSKPEDSEELSLSI